MASATVMANRDTQQSFRGPPASPQQPTPGAYMALSLLLGMNLFNYIDRQVLAAVEPEIRATLLSSHDPNGPMVRMMSGALALAFLLSYMLSAPVFGVLASRWPQSKWKLIALGVLVWSLATGAGGMATTFALLLASRCFVGMGEGAYGPLAPTILSDCFPVASRGKILSMFYIALPVGGALGYALGGGLAKYDPAHESWRWAFYAVVIPGLILGILSLFMRSSPVGAADAVATRKRMAWRDYKILLQTPSYVFDTLGMTAMTFSIGALAWWMPDYLGTHKVPDLFGIEPRTMFGIITALAGLGGTVAGGWAGDRLRERVPGSYFLVSGVSLFLSAPCVLLFLFVPFPWAWLMIFAAVFFMFVNTGPTNAILANVVHPAMRPAGFAVNILVIHTLGDAVSPMFIGAIVGTWNHTVGFAAISVFLAIGGLLWMWGGRYLQQDTELAPQRL